MYSYIFDIGGVLVRYEHKEIIEVLSEKTKCSCDEIDRLFQRDSLYPVETGRMSCDDFYCSRIKAVMPDISYEAWLQVFIEHYTVNPEGMELLRQLKEKGRKVYILSNLAEYHKIAIEKKIPGFFELCDKNFFSYELGYHKPEIEIYEQVYRNIGARPEECVFFDDIMANIEGAERAGMIGIHFSNENIQSIWERVRKLEAGYRTSSKVEVLKKWM